MSNTIKTCLVNGEETTRISVFDRGLMYGQSVFETIAVKKQECCLLDSHLQRLQKGANQIGINMRAHDIGNIVQDCERLASLEQEAVIKIVISIDGPQRGYATPANPEINRIAILSSAPDYPKFYWSQGISLGLSTLRLNRQPLLAAIKHTNRLEQVLIRQAWQTQWQEALVLDNEDAVVEATQSNVFLIKNKALYTPELSSCGVAGIMRQLVIQQADELGIECTIKALTLDNVQLADEIFVTNAIIGLWPVKHFEQRQFSDFTITHSILNAIKHYALVPSI